AGKKIQDFRDLVSGLGDEWGPFLKKWGDEIKKGLDELIAANEPLLNQLKDDFSAALADNIPKISTGLKDFSDAIKTLTPERMNELTTAFKAGFTEEFVRFGTDIAPVLPTLESLGRFVVSLNNLILALQRYSSGGTAQAGTTTDDMFSAFRRFFDGIHPEDLAKVENLAGPFGTLFKVLRDSGPEIIKTVD